MTGLFAGSLILGAYLLARRTSKLSTVEFTIGTPRIHKVTLSSIQAYIPLRYVNPSNAAQTVQALFFKIRNGERSFGTINRRNEFRIEPKAEKTVEVPVNITLGSGAAAIVSALGSRGPIPLNFDGYATVAGQEVRIRKEVPLDIRSYLSAFKNLLRK